MNERIHRYDYANLLFTGKCNSHCYDCIGRNPSLQGLPENTHIFPPKNIDGLIALVNEHNIPDLAFTGTNVDPQLCEYESDIIRYIRERLVGRTNLSLHTNGLLALKKMPVFNSYDKASISFPSFDPKTYRAITNVSPPDLNAILQAARIPVKLSVLVTPYNMHEMDEYIRSAADFGIKRVVVRKLKGREAEFPVEVLPPFEGRVPKKRIFGWPVYTIGEVEVTICDFNSSNAKGVFLFSDGKIRDYLVEECEKECEKECKKDCELECLQESLQEILT
jgi:MoaA/NifB/PqqE/SkfB family radical SAM enzyme